MKTNRRLSVDGEDSLLGRWKDHPFIRVFMYGFLSVALYVLMVGNIAPEVLDINVGSKAEKDIISPVTITDERATERAREQAAQQVDPVFSKDDSITDRQVSKLNNVFSSIKETISDDNLTDEDKQKQLKENIPYELDSDLYVALLNYSSSDIDTLRAVTRSVVYEIMHDGVREQGNGLQRAMQEVNNSLLLSSLDADLRKISREIAQASIVPNYVFNQEETERLRQEARDNVRSIEIREGEILAHEGEIITQELFRKLKLVGLLSESANLSPYFGLALFVVLIVSFLGIYINQSDLPIQKNNTHFLMFVIIFILNVLVLKIVSVAQVLEYSGIGFVAPVAFSTMLMTMLLHQRLAIFSSFMFGLIAAIILNAETTGFMDFSYAIVIIFSGAAGAFFLGKATRKSKILQAGFVVSAVSAVTVCAMMFLKSTPVGMLELSQYLLYALLSGVLASILTIGLLPFFEAAFGILSMVKLIELSNPNQKLLRKILVEAPGTYHHSVMVANLAEAATEAVGGNGLLARVGAYYHDIGKTKRPHFFIENQMNMGNPHDKIAPQLSTKIITAHATDGANMLKAERLPKAIQDIAEQHHGTTLLKYFYHKAKEESDCDVQESDFRYPGPKAQFKEAAIVGIADSIEAAVRSLSKPSPERIENMVRNIIKDRLEDGQFNECDLTLKELDTIAKVICETLQGIFHSRIEYPDELDKSLKKANAIAKDKGKESTNSVNLSHTNNSRKKADM